MSTHLKPAVGPQDHVQGSPQAPLELVEYGDYQCSYCGQAYEILKAVQQTLGNDLKFVFRNFPLSDEHPDALKAALAAEAAALQGKFWAMHDMLYQHQGQLESEHLTAYAKTVGLNAEQFQKDSQSDALAAKVEADFESGVRSGVNGTPSFYINGVKYEGDWQEQALTHELKSQLAQLTHSH